MLWEAVLLGLIIGWFRNGKLKNLGRISLPGWPLIFLAVLIQTVIWIDFTTGSDFLTPLYPILYVLSFVVLVVFFFLQGRQAGFIMIGFGILLNLVVITANRGMMPVDTDYMPTEVAEELEAGEKSPFHAPMTDETWLAFLGDRIRIPYRNQLLSIGDIVIGAGVIILIQNGMQGTKRKKQWR